MKKTASVLALPVALLSLVSVTDAFAGGSLDCKLTSSQWSDGRERVTVLSRKTISPNRDARDFLEFKAHDVRISATLNLYGPRIDQAAEHPRTRRPSVLDASLFVVSPEDALKARSMASAEFSPSTRRLQVRTSTDIGDYGWIKLTCVRSQ